MKKQCKTCLKPKERIPFMKDARNRSLYKDELGEIWHGLVCHACQLKYVKSKSGKQPLRIIQCQNCGKKVMQKTKIQRTCSKDCYKRLISD